MASFCKCGFYATKEMDGMCSQCFNRRVKEDVLNDLRNVEIWLKKSDDLLKEEALKLKNIQLESGNQAKKALKCGICNKKIGNLPIECCCEKLFCTRHRYPDEHKCTFDYKAQGRKIIEVENPKIVSDKFIKIL